MDWGTRIGRGRGGTWQTHTVIPSSFANLRDMLRTRCICLHVKFEYFQLESRCQVKRGLGQTDSSGSAGQARCKSKACSYGSKQIDLTPVVTRVVAFQVVVDPSLGPSSVFYPAGVRHVIRFSCNLHVLLVRYASKIGQ